MFELKVLVNSTKMDLIISRISDLKNQIGKERIMASFDRLNEVSELLVKEKGYEYFLRNDIETEIINNERRMSGCKRRRSNNE